MPRLVAQQRSVGALTRGAVDRAADRRRQRHEHDFAAFTLHPHDAVAVFLTEVVQADPGGLEHPESE